jgi:uncharacterized protein
MQIPTNKYCGDTELSRLLEKVGSKISLIQVYGLFYGCLSAPELAMPSAYHPLIFGEEGAEFESENEAQTVIGSLMALWNILSRWDPEGDDFFVPIINYDNTYGGLVQRLKDGGGFVEYFVKGLDLGDSDENDFSEDGNQALQDMAKNSAIMLQYAHVIEKDKDGNEKSGKTDTDNVEQLEDILADCVARINIGLKEARMRRLRERRMMSAPPPSSGTKIPRNAPCPCGSGKKYKKCCGLTH